MSQDNKTMILVGLGLAAFWVMSRQRVTTAGNYPTNYRGGAPTQSQQAAGLLNQGLNILQRLVGGNTGTQKPTNPATVPYNPSPSTAAAAAAAADLDNNPDVNGEAIRYTGNGSDGVAWNPPVGSPYDAAAGTSADGSY